MGGSLRTQSLLQLSGGALRKLVGSLMAIWLGWISSAREVKRRTWKTFMKLSLSLTDAYVSVAQYI